MLKRSLILAFLMLSVGLLLVPTPLSAQSLERKHSETDSEMAKRLDDISSRLDQIDARLDQLDHLAAAPAREY